jgi:hypothetical protein
MISANPFVYLDSCARNYTGKSDYFNFFDHIRGKREFNELDLEIVENEISDGINHLALLENENMRTISNSTEEVAHYWDRLGIALLSAQKEVLVDSDQFRGLYRLVDHLVNNFPIVKPKTGYYLSQRRDNQGNGNRMNGSRLPTDFEYATLCLCDSINGERPALFSCDTDFLSLFGELPRILGSDSFLPYNELFRESMVKNFPRYYHGNEGMANEIELTRALDFDIGNGYKRLKKRDVDEIKGMWERDYRVINWGIKR